MTKTAQVDAAITAFLNAWRTIEDNWARIPNARAPNTGAPTVDFGKAWWKTMNRTERALFDNFEDFGCAVSVRLLNS